MTSEALMERARELAERGRYTAAPNPLVGAVISHDGEPVAEGWHVRAGEHHAEIHALEGAGTSARGATMHVTLEPCNHHGRTPPCTEAILRSGIAKVVVGCLDPDPRMQGRSVELLRNAGIEVEVLEEPEFEVQNEQFFHYMRTGKPFVHLKLALSLDGKIAAESGDSKWITTKASRLQAHRLRAEAGAVLIGAGTARHDDPLLLPQDLSDEPPRITRVVLDPSLTTPLDGRLIKTSLDAPVMLIASTEAPRDRIRIFERAGVEVVGIQTSEMGLSLDSVLTELSARGIRGMLVEGGGETASRFLNADLVDKVTLFYAPRILGAEGVPAIGNLRLKRVLDAIQLRISAIEQVDGDLAVTLYPKNNLKEEDVHRAN